MIKQIFSDMDGTLLNEKGFISEGNIQAIKACGIPFTLVSARAPMEMFDTIDKLGLKSAQIAFNGGLIYKRKGDSIVKITENPMITDIVQNIVLNIRKQFNDISLSLYTDTKWYTDQIDDGIQLETSLTFHHPDIVDYPEFLKTTDEDIYKIMFIATTDDEMNTILKALDNLHLSGVSIQQSGNRYLEITSDKAKKSRGIRYIQELNNLEKSDMAAFGDGHNDIPMLTMVDTPIIMENAMDEVKRYAVHITKTNDEDGVAYGIQNFLGV
ncbi:HAD family hydrolase [Companilactobacillus hulinensis]|uniref:HAD family hydrolase n=1 Tax=Companilactobacillus hulinensis TaxID=2486007 RepID=UPI000F773BF7|nr:HAD family hydrolase [Companilactobacillus hulinensis]